MIALSSECPHLGCAVNLTADGKSFLCPCHTSAFDLEGTKKNAIPPRNMDRSQGRARPRGMTPRFVSSSSGSGPRARRRSPLIKQLADWLDDRTGFRELMKEALDEPIPGGARWRYVFGSALTVVFMVQVFTGILLMTSYSPSSSMAWASVFYISHDMWWGWFIRGVHHFAAQAMVVLLVLHLLQVLWAGAYRRPREFNWWFGMALLFLTLGFSLTGYLLPWDQKGYWATKVATNIMGGAPVAGPYLQKILVGGPDYGNQTVTRFYGLHVGVLPTLLVLCLAAHIALFRRHGITPSPNAVQRPDRQVLARTALHGHGLQRRRRRRRDLLVLAEGGANLDAPADPVQLRLSRAARVVFLVAVPDAQAVSRRP